MSTISELSGDERQELTQVLSAWKAAGEPSPLIPVYGDDPEADDFYSLNDKGKLVVVSGPSFSQTIPAKHDVVPVTDPEADADTEVTDVEDDQPTEHEGDDPEADEDTVMEEEG